MLGATAAELRPADAICIDATFGEPHYVFPPPEAALALAEAFVKDALAAKKPPVLLTPAFGTAIDVAAALAAAGFALRGHRAVVAAATAFRAAGATVPAIARFDGKLGPQEVLLWPPEFRDAPVAGAAGGRRASPSCRASASIRRRWRTYTPTSAIPLSNQADHAQLLAYVAGSGAREVAVHRGNAEAMAATLRARGLDAYPLGPPRQMELFRG